ncbi:MAG: shikimate dehydrogenase [Paracoccaceae bacterium]|jgi:shikimate dehydrogenase
MSIIQLGLIGDNIARSRAPLLHQLAGRQAGLTVVYERLIPKDLGLDFDATFARCAALGFRGVNVTYPYKEVAAAKVRIEDPLVRRIGAVNTVVFSPDGPLGYNTDYSGFKAAWRDAMDSARPGAVCLIGAGGVGKAVAFGLLGLGVQEIRLVDSDTAKADALARTLRATAPDAVIHVAPDAEHAAAGAEGLINCTPLGMVGHDGSALPRAMMRGAAWAFDAVYTPIDTQFLRDAADEGLKIISGYELFFHQGVDAWDIFVGRTLSHDDLRRALAAAPPDA